MDTSKIKKGLGRGLSSLIGETKTEKNTSSENETTLWMKVQVCFSRSVLTQTKVESTTKFHMYMQCRT